MRRVCRPASRRWFRRRSGRSVGLRRCTWCSGGSPRRHEVLLTKNCKCLGERHRRSRRCRSPSSCSSSWQSFVPFVLIRGECRSLPSRSFADYPRCSRPAPGARAPCQRPPLRRPPDARSQPIWSGTPTTGARYCAAYVHDPYRFPIPIVPCRRTDRPRGCLGALVSAQAFRTGPIGTLRRKRARSALRRADRNQRAAADVVPTPRLPEERYLPNRISP